MVLSLASLSLSLVFPARFNKTLPLSLSFYSTLYVEPRSDKDLGESLRESLLLDFLGK
jgi:hypothetical protein